MTPVFKRIDDIANHISWISDAATLGRALSSMMLVLAY
jgi:hypothetical protein